MIPLFGAFALLVGWILDCLGLLPKAVPTPGRGSRKRLKGCTGDGYGSRRNNY